MNTEPLTFQNFDQLKLSNFGTRLTEFISIDRHFVDGALILSLSGGFGSGKSTFLEMWRHQISETEGPAFDTLLLNAWDADFLSDPLLSIASSILKHFEVTNPSKTEKLKELAGWLSRFSVATLNEVTKAVTKIDATKIVDAADSNPKNHGMKCFELFEDRKKSFGEMKSLLEKLASDADRPIIVIVDELDRCRPDYAVEYLEVIKHIFDIKNIVFVLGVDRDSLASSVRAMFGSSINFDEYFRKFSHRNITLPQGDSSTIMNFAAHLGDYYLKNKAVVRNIDHHIASYERSKECKILPSLKPSPRQLHEAIRISTHAMTSKEKRGGGITPDVAEAINIMSLLSVTRPHLYRRLGSPDCSAIDALDYLELFRGDRDIFNNSMGKGYLIHHIKHLTPRDLKVYLEVSKGLLNRQLIYTDEDEPFEPESFAAEIESSFRHFTQWNRSHDETLFQTVFRTLDEADNFAR